MSNKFSRRNLLELGAGIAGLAVAGGRLASAAPVSDAEEATIAQLQAAMYTGQFTALSLVQSYLARIDALDKSGPKLNSIIEINPEAEAIAAQLDAERRSGKVRGPLHGIPILLKDNIDTGDRMQTAAGSLALVGTPAPDDSTVASKLRAAGAVILGKTNLSEWANFRASYPSSGWSGRAGQCRNPYVLDRNPGGSSSGSATATAASLCAASLGTETNGSIIMPASMCGVVGMKPTLGLVSRDGVIPIAHSQDTIGALGRTVADVAALLGTIASTTPDPPDPATSLNRDKVRAGYLQFVNPDGLRGAFIGVVRTGTTGYSEEADGVFETAVQAMKDAGATLFDVEIPTIDQIYADDSEITVLVYEFKRDLNAYLATRSGVPIHNLADLIAFNTAHADQEMKWFGQEMLEWAESDPYDQEAYQKAVAHLRQICGPLGIDAALRVFPRTLDALVAPAASPACPIDLVNGDGWEFCNSGPAAIAGYPSITVPAGEAFGLPVGVIFMGTAFSEPALIRIASGFEAVTKARRKPKFLSTLPMENTPLARVNNSTFRSKRQVRRFGLF